MEHDKQHAKKKVIKKACCDIDQSDGIPIGILLLPLAVLFFYFFRALFSVLRPNYM